MLSFISKIEKDKSSNFSELEIAQKLRKYKHVLVAFCGFLKL